MRHDMKRVLTERPRVRNILNYRSTRRCAKMADYDDLPSKEGISLPYRNDPKEFSDLLGPLIRFLQKCIGRPWDDVWSEVCQQLSNNTVDSHLKGHVLQEVETKCFVRDGKVLAYGRFGVHEPYRLYVDPETGLICPAIARKTKTRLSNSVRVDGLNYERFGKVYVPYSWHNSRVRLIDGTNEGVKIDGIWYWVGFEMVPPPVLRHYTDPVIAKTVGARRVGPNRYVKLIDCHKFDFVLQKQVPSGQRCRVDKRQMSRADLRRYGIAND